MLLPILLLPTLIPILVGAVEGTASLLSGGALEFTGTPDPFAGLGAGGYVGAGVPSCRLGFACVGNRMAHALDEGPLSKTLMSAMMSCF